jgi:hypothetical protein
MSSHAPVSLPLFVTSLTEAAGDALCLCASLRGAGGLTVLVDLRAWPPRLAEHHGGALNAARSRGGEWLVHAYAGDAPPYAWRLRTYAAVDAEAPRGDEGEPIPAPDLTEVLAHLEGASRDLEATRGNAVEDVAYLGDHAILLPRQVGLAGRRHPWIHRDGAWVEERSLPAFSKDPSEVRERCSLHTVALADGGDVLVWDGFCFEQEGRRGFARTFEHRIDAPWWHPWSPVPAGSDGFFYLEGGMSLAEIHRGGAPRRLHLPGVHLRRAVPGPDGTIVLLKMDGGAMIYDPREETIAAIPPDLLETGDRVELLWWSSSGFLVSFARRDGELRAASRADLDALPREHASAVVERESAPRKRPASAALQDGRSASRPRLCAHGARDLIVTASERELHAHTVDEPLWGLTWEHEIVAVAADGRRVIVLDASGRLHALRPESGMPAGAVGTGSSPRSLAVAAGGLIAVLDAGGVYLDDSLRKLPFELPLAAAFDGDGRRLLVTGERRRAALIVPEAGTVEPLPPPPEEVHAVAWTGKDRWIALGERSLLRFDLAARAWEVAEATQVGDHVARSPSGALLAVAVGKGSVHVVDAETLAFKTAVNYPDTYSSSEDPLAVTGLAFLDEERLVVGLTRNNANILRLGGGAQRLDTFPGAPDDRWILIYDGDFLCAG